jgi:hypothetical protein
MCMEVISHRKKHVLQISEYKVFRTLLESMKDYESEKLLRVLKMDWAENECVFNCGGETTRKSEMKE